MDTDRKQLKCNVFKDMVECYTEDVINVYKELLNSKASKKDNADKRQELWNKIDTALNISRLKNYYCIGK